MTDSPLDAAERKANETHWECCGHPLDTAIECVACPTIVAIRDLRREAFRAGVSSAVQKLEKFANAIESLPRAIPPDTFDAQRGYGVMLARQWIRAIRGLERP